MSLLNRRKFLRNLFATGVISAVAPVSLLSAPTNIVGTMPMVTVDAKGIVTCRAISERALRFTGLNQLNESTKIRTEMYKITFDPMDKL